MLPHLHAHRDAAALPADPKALRYFALLALLSLPFYALGLLGPWLRDTLQVNLPLSALMAVCPLIAALWLSHREPGGGRGFIRDAFASGGVPRGLWWWISLLLMPAVIAVSYLASVLLGRPMPVQATPWFVALIALPVFVLTATCEQLGWQAYAASRLDPALGALGSALCIGLIWAAWHVVPYTQAGHGLAWVFWQCTFTVALRVVLSWLHANANRSLPAVIVGQAGSNTAFVMFPFYGSHYEPVAAALVTLAVVVVLLSVSDARSLLLRQRA